MAGFEELPQEFQDFFNTGGEKVPPALLAAEPPEAVTPPEVTAPVTPPVEAAAAVTPPAGGIDPAIQQILDAASRREVELRSQYADNERKLKGELDALNAKVTKLTAVPPPDPQTDPIGHVLHKINELALKVEGASDKQTQTLEQNTQRDQFTAFANKIDAAVADFTKTHTDYQDAYAFVRASREKQLVMVGYSPDEAKQKVGQEELEIVDRAFRANKNPAESAYILAQQLGYKPKVAAAPPENKLEAIQKGMHATQGIERSGGKPSGSPDVTSSMTDDEMNDLVQNKWDSVFGVGKNIF